MRLNTKPFHPRGSRGRKRRRSGSKSSSSSSKSRSSSSSTSRPDPSLSREKGRHSKLIMLLNPKPKFGQTPRRLMNLARAQPPKFLSARQQLGPCGATGSSERDANDPETIELQTQKSPKKPKSRAGNRSPSERL